ncbi:hypothetical protein [Nocardioides sp.]|uniref:hypothetical protein n=1 Tax=Nocardioides sp. TaxID=35761 RepID=UPI002B9D333F|nr:hypothetical protein [Nocardioides sp.]HXH80131.1 hypothetical protein [Nocardioides sp.]
MTQYGGTDAPVTKWVAVPLVLALLATIGFLGWAVFGGQTPTESSHPKAWDKRVKPYVKLVEKSRGFDFMHPVEVRFLPAGEFRKSVRADAAELSGDDREELEKFEGFFRALGLISGDVDLLEASNDASSGATLAYYSFEDRRITVRGKTITAATKSTVVHELTHALQDQHFGIGDQFEALEGADEDDTEADGASSVLRAVVEGDAVRIEAAYAASLNAKERAALVRAQRKLYEEAGDRTARQDVPEVILTLMGAPYALGSSLVEIVAADGGNGAVNSLLRRGAMPHDDVLLDPFLFLAGEGAGRPPVKAPGTMAGEEEFDSGEFGALGWYFLLAERMPLRDALAAVRGWDGDAYVAYERDDVTCARMAVRNDSAAGAERMHQALQRWVAAAPRSGASVTIDGSRLEFESCDPGTEAAPGNDASQEALDLVTVRNSLALQLLNSSAAQPLARCSADRIIAEYSVEQLVDPAFGVSDPAVTARIQQIVADCR